MKILKTLLYIVVSLGVLTVILGLFAKKDYRIERSLEIDAPKEMVYEYVRYFKNLEAWSPWSALDPNMKVTISGTDGEVGAVHAWSGNEDAGEGSQTITAMTPDRIDIEVLMLRPFKMTSPTYMAFEERGSKTNVTWVFNMHVPFPWNGFAMFTDMDAGVGRDYEQGLINLRKICEEMAHKKYRGYEIAAIEIPLKYYVGVRQYVDTAAAVIGQFYATNLPKAMEAIQKSGIVPAGAPSGLFWAWADSTGKADMAAAVPIAEEKKFGKDLSVFPVGGGNALLIEHLGAYDTIGVAHLAMDDYMTEKGLEAIPPVIEEYVTDPGQEPDTAKWLTRVIYFVKPVATEGETPEDQ